jgi:hypothetical protein
VLLHVCLHPPAKKHRELLYLENKCSLFSESRMCFFTSAFIRLQEKSIGKNKIQERNCSLFSGSRMCFFTSAFIRLQQRAKGITKFREHVRSFKRETVPSSSSVKYAFSLLPRHIAAQKEQQHSKKITLFF